MTPSRASASAALGPALTPVPARTSHEAFRPPGVEERATLPDGSTTPADPTPRPPRASTGRPMKPTAASRYRAGFSTLAWFAAAWGLLVALWEIGAAHGVLNPQILPPPSQTLPYLLEGSTSIGFGVQRTSLLQATLATVLRIALGLSLGVTAALGCAALIFEFMPGRRLVMPIVQTLAPVSPVAWIPFAIAVVGIGAPAAVFVVFMAIFGSVTISAVAALDAVPNEYLKVAVTLGTPRRRIWRKVLIPAAAPAIMTTLRMSLFGAWMAVLAGEMAGINSGLGYLITMGQQMFNMKLVMVGIVTIGVIGFLMDRGMLLLQRRLIWWERT